MNVRITFFVMENFKSCSIFSITFSYIVCLIVQVCFCNSINVHAQPTFHARVNDEKLM